MKKLLPIPAGAPRKEEIWRHYKGNSYKVYEIALDSDDEWVAVYEPLYENAVAKLFTRPVAEWREVVEWQGQKIERFVKI